MIKQFIQRNAMWGKDEDGELCLKFFFIIFCYHKWANPVIFWSWAKTGFESFTDTNSKNCWRDIRKGQNLSEMSEDDLWKLYNDCHATQTDKDIIWEFIYRKSKQFNSNSISA